MVIFQVPPNPRSAIRLPETVHCDQVARRAGDGQIRFAVNLKNLVQLYVQVGEASRLANSHPPGGWGESATLRRENGYQTSECKG